jgi:hypothetical protein
MANNNSNRVLLGKSASNYVRKAKSTKASIKSSLLNLSPTEKSILGILLLVSIIVMFVLVKQKLRQGTEIRSITEPIFMSEFPHDGAAELAIGGNQLPTTNSNQFTYSFWIYIDSTRWEESRYKNKWKHIFHYGQRLNTGNRTHQIPGCWIWPNTNRLWCVVTDNKTEGNYGEGIIVDDLPLNQWTNVTMVLNRRMFDVYINGKLHRTVSLYNEIVINSVSNLYIASGESTQLTIPDDLDTKDVVETETTVTSQGNPTVARGFPGYIAIMAYYNRALTPAEIYKLYLKYKSKVAGWDKSMLNGLSGTKCTKVDPIGKIFGDFFT